MSNYIYIASYFLFFVTLLYSFILNFIRYMHMFQLNSYHASEQFKWIKENMGEVLKRHVPSLLAAAFAFVSCFIMNGTLY